MKSPSPPPAPDPVATAQAQTTANRETAVANAYLNRVNQNSPFGSVNYKVIGTNPDGTPQFEQNTSFSPEAQGIFDNYMGMTKGMGDVGLMQLGGLRDMYSKPFDLNTEAEGKIAELMAKRLDPQLARNNESLRTRLTNQGIREGTEAWDRALMREGEVANDARNSMWLSARQQGVNEALLQRQLPLNEFNAFRMGSQMQSPQFNAVPQTAQANTDVAGITQAGYQNQMQAWQQQNQQRNAFMGGLFGLGTAGLGMLSDARLKTDVRRVGAMPSGLPLYQFRYVWGGPVHVGVMAQEARELFPDAVHDIGGYLAVDYGKVR